MKTPDRLYDLLPLVYRQRDVQQGGVLQALLRVMAEQLDLVENDIDQLYDNWFIETCEDWVVPYIADLIGYRPVHPLGDTSSKPSAALGRFLAPRREVANTIAYRRRKGTLALLQDLATAVTGWPAVSVEFHQSTGASLALDHVHASNGRYADLRDADALDRAGGPFDRVSHTTDIRSVNSPYQPGRFNAAAVGVFLWRLQLHAVTHSPAYCQEEAGNHCFTFSILGNDVPLFNRPASGTPSAVRREVDTPSPIRRRAFESRVEGSGAAHAHAHASEEYYGEGRSVAIWAPGWGDSSNDAPIPATKIVPADLSDWRYRPRPNHVGVDPELGRIVFPVGERPERGVWVSYVYGFGSDLGGGEYPRPVVTRGTNVSVYSVGAGAQFHRILDAYQHWHKSGSPRAVIELTDSGVYEEQLHIKLDGGRALELRAAVGARPVIFLADWHASRPDALTISGDAGSTFTLDGVLITGRGMEVRGRLDTLTIRHSTLVPGWALHHDCKPRRPGEPSLSLRETGTRVNIHHSILGAIQVLQDDEAVDPIQLRISDSIVDANTNELPALIGSGDSVAAAVVTVARSTVFGQVQAHSIALAEDSIFTGQVLVARRQYGCMRFCYVPTGSRTPRRYHCQPDLVEQAIASLAQHERLDAHDRKGLLRVERSRVEPDFLGTRYGRPDYARLAENCAVEIRAGASDRAEMGVFHDLFQPQREDNLRARLAEYTPVGVDAGIIFAT
jgi:hypothetical protein